MRRFSVLAPSTPAGAEVTKHSGDTPRYEQLDNGGNGGNDNDNNHNSKHNARRRTLNDYDRATHDDDHADTDALGIITVALTFFNVGLVWGRLLVLILVWVMSMSLRIRYFSKP